MLSYSESCGVFRSVLLRRFHVEWSNDTIINLYSNILKNVGSVDSKQKGFGYIVYVGVRHERGPPDLFKLDSSLGTSREAASPSPAYM